MYQWTGLCIKGWGYQWTGLGIEGCISELVYVPVVYPWTGLGIEGV